MAESINLRVPKSMRPEDFVWAFRYGVAWARYRAGASGTENHNETEKTNG